MPRLPHWRHDAIASLASCRDCLTGVMPRLPHWRHAVVQALSAGLGASEEEVNALVTKYTNRIKLRKKFLKKQKSEMQKRMRSSKGRTHPGVETQAEPEAEPPSGFFDDTEHTLTAASYDGRDQEILDLLQPPQKCVCTIL